MNKQRRRPLKQLCGCPEQNFRLVWWHKASAHNDHVWRCCTCNKMWLEWIPSRWPDEIDIVLKHQIVDQHEVPWSFTDWDTTRFKFTTNNVVIDGKRGHEVAIVVRAE